MSGDWSSDVCSSDLLPFLPDARRLLIVVLSMPCLILACVWFVCCLMCAIFLVCVTKHALSATQSHPTFISCSMFVCLQNTLLPCWLKLHFLNPLRKTNLERSFKILSLPLLERSARYEAFSTSTKKPVLCNLLQYGKRSSHAILCNHLRSHSEGQDSRSDV